MGGHSSEALDKGTSWGGGVSPFRVSYGKMMMWFFLVSDALTFSGLLIAYGFERHKMGDWPVGEKVFNAFPGTDAYLPLLYVALMTFILIVSSVTMVLAVEAGHRLDKKGVIKWLALTVVGGLFFLLSQVWEWSHFIHGDGGYVVMEDGSKYQLENDPFAHGHDFDASLLALIPCDLSENRKYGQDFWDENGEIIPTEVITGGEALRIWENKIDYYHGANMTRNEYGPKQYANFFFFVTGFHGFHVFSGVVINFIVLIMVMRGVFDKRGHYEMVEKTGLYWHFVDLVWVFVFTFYYLV
ncbi:MAG: cytochrome oxidase subunit III [Flavobacteriales bacterium]|nr:cytochrome oxidase subunit III [Flavobacteriales bacterium]